MFASKAKTTVIAEGLRIIGSVSADGAVQVNGQIDGDLNCTSITVSPKAFINVVLKSHAFVTGDIQAQSLSIERGAHFEGRSLRPDATNLRQLETPTSNGQGQRAQPVVFKKEDEPKTKVARA
jgi:cytoskeletal protein CcmA (bactofilin family)